MNSEVKKYQRRGIGWIAVYVVIMFGIIFLIDNMDDDNWLRFIVVLLPMVPATMAAVEFIRSISAMDELQQKIQFQALAFAFVMTALLTFSYGFLERVGFPRLTMFAVWPILATSWIVGVWLGNRRYA